MDIKNLILQAIKKKKIVRVSDIVKKTGFSRAYVNRFFRELRDEGSIVLIGKANQARYILASKEAVLKSKKEILDIKKTLLNKGLSEDIVFDEIRRDTGIFLDLSKNISDIVEYAFTEILNNAIEHSRSKKIDVIMRRTEDKIIFHVRDEGVGIFKNIMNKRRLKNEMEAVQDLLKGKQTTAPNEHSGEGIFFTSKVADVFTIQSSKKKLEFNNIVDDIFVHTVKETKGTRAVFAIAISSKRRLDAVFKEYAGESFEFSKTNVAVRLYKMGNVYISRSQARRIVSGLDKFKTIELDFKKVKTVGQSFADEIFRVWQHHHPGIKIIVKNTNEDIDFMIERAKRIKK